MTGVHGDLSVEARARYAYVEALLRADLDPPASVVELGSAPGDQIARLAELGYRATSVDIGESSDSWGPGEEGRMQRLLADAGVENVTWDLEVTPYPLDSDAFDAVVMTEVFEHLRDYPITSLHEIARILRPGGRLYFTTPNSAYLMNRLRLLAGRNVQTPLHDWIGGIPHARHAREYTFSEVEHLMDLAGLHVVSLTSRHFHQDSGKVRSGAKVAKRALGWLATVRPSLGPLIIVVAEKKAG